MSGYRTLRPAIVGTIVILLAAAVAAPYVLGSYYVSLLTLALIGAILASSVNFLAGNAGLVSLGHAGIAAAAGYGLAWAYRQGWDTAAQLGMALALTLIASIVYGIISMRTRGVPFLMVTLAAGMIIYGVAYRWSSVTGGTNGIAGIRRPAGIAQYWQFYFVVLLLFLVVTAVVVVVDRSPFGLTLRGVRDSETRMVSLGYHVAGYKFGAMLLSGLMAGTAGVLSVWQSEFISPVAAGFQASALSVIMVALGGTGTILGPLVGAGLVTASQHMLSSVFERWSTLLGVLFILSVMFAPQGIVGGVDRFVRRIRRRRAEPAPAPEPPQHPMTTRRKDTSHAP